MEFKILKKLIIGAGILGAMSACGPDPRPPKTELCGNGIIDAGENCENCIEDIACASYEVCTAGKCETPKTELCGNGIADEGENCENCIEDIACASYEECIDGKCETPIIEKAEVCKGVLPAAYETFLENNKNIADSLVWANSENREGKPYATDCARIESLAKSISGENALIEPPMPAEILEQYGVSYFSEQDAWGMYISHVANSLKQEVERSLPWSIKKYDKSLLKLLLDGREFIAFIPSKNLYRFSPTEKGGRGGVTDWNPKIAVDFLSANGMIAERQEETIYRLTQWVRANLVHASTSTPKNWDGYPEAPPLEKILYPPTGARHWIGGCGAASTFYISMLHAVNIPVVRGISTFTISREPKLETGHSRIEFPVQQIAFAHSDDPYGLYNRRGKNEIPVEKLFLTLGELETLIDNPAIDDSGDYIPTKGEMALYNKSRRDLLNAFEYRADKLIAKRAQEILGSAKEGTLERILMGYDCNNDMCLWKPLFDGVERALMASAIDATLTAMGGGSIENGSRIAVQRLSEYPVP